MKLPKSPPKDKRIAVRFTEAEYKVLIKAAKRNRTTLSEHVRKSCLDTKG